MPTTNAFSYPVLAVDTTSGPYSGRIYLVWPDTVGTEDWDIRMSYSDDEGDTWSTPVRVNDDSLGNGANQFNQWASVDAEGGLNVMFFDTRDDPNDNCPPESALVDVYVARSVTGGATFENFRVNDHAFSASCKFPGDYLGIASTRASTYPCWAEDPGDHGQFETVVATVPILFEKTGIVESDETWKWNIQLTGDVLIDSGTTLTLSRGTRVYAAATPDTNLGADSGLVELIVNGTLALEAGDPGVLFTGETDTMGSWYGIRIGPGGRVVNQGVAEILYATVGLTIDSGAVTDTIEGFTISHSAVAGIWSSSSQVALIHDTIADVPNGYGIYLDVADPGIQECHIAGCEYGLYGFHSSSDVRSISVEGPGVVGINLVWGGMWNGVDTMLIDECSVNGYFSDCHVKCSESFGVIDSSEFITGIDETGVSPYGMKAYGTSSEGLKVRWSKIQDFNHTGFYAEQGGSNLGTPNSGHGNNMISTSDTAHYLVKHVALPWTSKLNAYGNWWGEDNCPPESSMFVHTFFDQCLDEPPLGKRGAGIAQVVEAPQSGLGVNYPNPFNPSTTIQFNLAAPSQVRLEVFNILGQRVRTLVDRFYSAGAHQITWDGKNASGDALASGVYVYRIVTEVWTEARKMLLLK